MEDLADAEFGEHAGDEVEDAGGDAAGDDDDIAFQGGGDQAAELFGIVAADAQVDWNCACAAAGGG